jgi:histidinol-phosphate aminotransferase
MKFDPLTLAVDGVRNLSAYIPGKNEQQLTAQYGIEHWTKLDANENPLGAPSSVTPVITESLSGIGRYPDGAGTELSRRLAQRHGVNPNQITLGNGSDDVLLLAARTFAGPGTSIISSEHAFAMYSIAARSVSARDIRVNAKHYAHDLAAMASAVTDDTRLVYIANPNNPTGTYATTAQLDRFMQSMPTDVIVVIDQAYAEYVDRDDYADCTRWLNCFPNLIVTRTFSKVFGLAGLRCGYAVSSAAVADLMNRVRSPFNVNTLAQIAAGAALEDGDFLARSLALNQRGLVQLGDGFKALNLDFIESIGNFICVDIGRPGRPVFEQLLKRGVIVRQIDNYGLPNHLRFTVGLEAENATALTVLGDVLNNIA